MSSTRSNGHVLRCYWWILSQFWRFPFFTVRWYGVVKRSRSSLWLVGFHPFCHIWRFPFFTVRWLPMYKYLNYDWRQRKRNRWWFEFQIPRVIEMRSNTGSTLSTLFWKTLPIWPHAGNEGGHAQPGLITGVLSGFVIFLLIKDGATIHSLSSEPSDDLHHSCTVKLLLSGHPPLSGHLVWSRN